MSKKNNGKESVQEKIERMKREKEEAAAKPGTNQTQGLVSQLTHEDDGAPDFAELASKLEQRHSQEYKGKNDGYVKMTIYIKEEVARSFKALCLERGQKKAFGNQAIADFVLKKSRELEK